MARKFYWISSAIPVAFLFFSGDLVLSGVALGLCLIGLLAAHKSEAGVKKTSLDEVREQSLRDDLTGLPNRRAFMEQLRTSLMTPLKQDGNTAVFFIDLDNFKGINDTLGHSAGDRVLLEVSSRLTKALPEGYILARMGGDELTILGHEVRNRQELSAVAEALLRTFATPIVMGGEEVWVNGSMGVVMAPMPRPPADDFLAMADTALYNAKSRGKGQFILFEPNLPRPVQRPLSLDADLRSAVRKNEMLLHFQPIADLRTMSVSGFEALIRWKHPRYGLLQPEDFIPLAEQSGLIRAIGTWVIEEGCKQISVWQSLSGTPLTLSINLSALQFRQRDLLSHFATGGARNGISPGSLILEITESILVQEDANTHKNLQELRDMGFGIAVDDFGVGYSSLGYLKNFDADVLKLDQSFLADLDAPKGEALLRSVIHLGRSLELVVLAEGIETERQLAVLQDADCQLGQGGLLGDPMPESEITELLLAGGLLRTPAGGETPEPPSDSLYNNAPRQRSASI